MDDDLHIYAVGILSLSVCAPTGMDTDEIELRVNRKNMSGTTSGWCISNDEEFPTGEPMPCPCNACPATRQHWLLDC